MAGGGSEALGRYVVEVENPAYEGALTTPWVKGSKSVLECKSWTGSRLCQPSGDSVQNLCIFNEGIVETGGVEEDQTVAFELWEIRNGDDICRVRFSSTRSRVPADFHLVCPDDIVNELQIRRS